MHRDDNKTRLRTAKDDEIADVQDLRAWWQANN